MHIYMAYINNNMLNINTLVIQKVHFEVIIK